MPSKPRSFFNRRRGEFSIENGSDEAKVVLYDEIGMWGVMAKDFIDQLDGISARTIHLHINSPGGDVFQGFAIANAIRAHSARVITHVDGLAASIASIIALAGDYVRMSDNAFLMIHNPYMLAIGNAAELRKNADVLDKIGGSIVNEYVKRSGQSATQMQALMDAETWFTASEAKATGFVDAIDNAESEDPIENRFDLAVYKNAPAALLQEPAGDPTVRELEHAVREAGLSRSHAKQLVAAGLRSITQRDAVVDDTFLAASNELLAAIRNTH
jgi:ATP-dependent Clp protease protease subunit